MRGAMMVAVVSALLLSGCMDSSSSGFGFLTVRVTNEGGSTMPAAITVTAPDGTGLLEETVQARGGRSVDRTVDATQIGTYTVFVAYDKSTSSQEIHGSQRHTIQNSDCETTAVVVEFVIDYTATSGGGSFSNQGSHGLCVEGP